MWRGVGGFLLFLLSYSVLGSLVGVLTVGLLAARLFPAPAQGSLGEQVFLIIAGIASGFIGVWIGDYVLKTALKGGYPSRGIGIAFVLFLAANYLLHFVLFPENTDFTTYSGLIQSVVASLTAWFVFHLPPLPSRGGATTRE